MARGLLALTAAGLAVGAVLAGAPGREGAGKAPAVALFFSGDLQGRVCEGRGEESEFLGPLGGAARFATVYQKWGKERPDRIIVDVGNATAGDHEAAATVNRLTLDALERLGCEVANCGDREAALPLERLLALQEGRELRLISASLLRAENRRLVFPPYVVLERGGTRVAIVGLVDGVPPERLGEGLALLDAAETLRASVAVLQDKADLIVVLAWAGPERIYELARAVPEVDVFLGGRAPATSAPFEIEGKALIAYLGDEGRTLGRLDAAFPKGRRPLATGRVALPSGSTPRDPTLAKLETQLRAAVGESKVPGADWDLKMPCTTSYVGPQVCRLCHIKQFYTWQNSDHSGAYATLLKKGEQKNAACLSCHTTGYRMPSGFDPDARVSGGGSKAEKVRQRTQQALRSVGCECCHGGSRRHLGVAIKDRLAATKAPQLRAGPSLRNCGRCHEAERPCIEPGELVPYDPEAYLQKIKHWE